VRKLPIILLTVFLLGLAVATWGSVGSAVAIFALVELLAAVLYKRYLVEDREDDFQSE
jgi:hypothetical protein